MKRYVIVLTFLALLSSITLGQAPQITEYLLATASASPTGVALGPDGNLWVTEMAANNIAKITPDGTVVEYPIPSNNSQPFIITAGPDGNLWFTESAGNKIGQITLAGVITEYALPANVSFSPEGITAGPDGNLWFTESLADKIGKITTSGAITEYLVPTSAADPANITAGPDGRLWFTEAAASKVGAITTAGVITEYSLVAGYSGKAFAPWGITQGPDGNLWVTGAGIWSVTVGGVATSYSVQMPNFQPGGIVTGPDGNLWFTDQDANKIGTMTTSGVLTEYAIPSASSAPANIAVGSDGNLWFTEQGTNRVAKLILLTTPPLTGPLTVSPSSLAFTAYVGGPAPPSQTLTISSPTPTTFTATSSVPITIGRPWLQISPSGDLTTNQTITVTVNPAGVGGSYATNIGTITLTSGSFTQTVEVSLTITPPLTTGNISVTPSSVSYNVNTEGGGSLPQEIVVNATTPGVPFPPVTISYNVISPPGGNWLLLSTNAASSGAIPSGVATTAGVGYYPAINTSELSPGTYKALITVAATGGNTVTVPVTLNLSAGATTLSTSPSVLDFDWQIGAPRPAPQSFQVVESGIQEPFLADVSGGGIILTYAITGNSVAVSLYPTGLSVGTYMQPVFVDALPYSLGLDTSASVLLRVTDPTSNISEIDNAASLVPGVITPGEMIAIRGNNLGPSTPLNLELDSNGKVATSSGGVTVSIGGHLAPLVYVSATQINCVVPYELIFGNVYVPVVVTYGGQQSTYTMTAGKATPAIFTSSGSGTGPVAALNSSGGYNGPNNPAAAGSTIVFYVTGEGQTLPAGVTGAVTTINTSLGANLTPIPLLPLRVTIGGVPAPVTFFGEAPDIVSGAMQINAQIPNGLPSGNVPLLVSLGGSPSQSGVTVSVR